VPAPSSSASRAKSRFSGTSSRSSCAPLPRCPRRARRVTGPDLLPHFNGFPAAKINGAAAPGDSSGQAIAAMAAVAREVLPQGYAFAWSGLARLAPQPMAGDLPAENAGPRATPMR
jgi:AcrB/AcrD/AcrF family